MIRAALIRFAVLACVGATVATVAACSGGDGPSGPTVPATSARPPAPPSTVTPDMATAMANTARAVTAVTSYDYRHLDTDHATVLRYVTDPFRATFESTWAGVRAEAPSKHTVVRGSAGNVGVSEFSADRLVAVVFGQQTWTNTTSTTPRIEPVAVRATMTRTSGQWLLSRLDVLGSTSAGDRARTAWAAPGIAAAVLAGRECAAVLNTLRARDVESQLDRMRQCATGELLSTLTADADRLRQAATKSASRATVVAAGVSTASPDRVTLLAGVAVHTTPRSGTPADQLSRLVLTLQQDGGQWLVSKVEQLPVQ